MNQIVKGQGLDEEYLLIRLFNACLNNPGGRYLDAYYGDDEEIELAEEMYDEECEGCVLSQILFPYLKERGFDSSSSEIFEDMWEENSIGPLLDFLGVRCQKEVIYFLDRFQTDLDFGNTFGRCLEDNKISLPSHYKELLGKIRKEKHESKTLKQKT